MANTLCLTLLSCLWLMQNAWSLSNDVYSKPNNTCRNPACTCCREPVTCQDDACGGQCITGIFGNKCLNNCPSNCVECKDPDNPTGNTSLWGVANCTECKPGYYSSADYYQCQFKCPGGCEICTSATDCTSCKTGYYQEGTTCSKCPIFCASCTSTSHCSQCKDGYYRSGGNRNCIECSTDCWNGTCDKDSGKCDCKTNYTGEKCDRCVDGWYGQDSGCQSRCKSPCTKCISSSKCTSCLDGYFLQGDGCIQCKPGCALCSSSDSCQQCNNGYYKSVSDITCLPCSSGCSGQCDRQNGSCKCKTKFIAGYKCDVCAQNIQNQTYPDCDKCIEGYHGDECNQTCPSNCNNTVCEKKTGQCTQGCKGNFDGNNCTTCKNGWHGAQCDTKCPENCLDDACEQSNGYCLSCKSNYQGNTCNECVSGQYGNACESSCPTNCKGGLCDRDYGKCDQCDNGFTGDRCCLEGPGCQFCSSASLCSKCIPGKHGEHCDQECPANCANNICDKVNGTCITCVDGFHGNNCHLAVTGIAPGSGNVPGIVGGLIGGLAFIIAIIPLVWCWKRRSSNRTSRRKPLVNTEDLTPNSVYANDPVITEGPNASSAVTDLELSSTASRKKVETRLSTTLKSDTVTKPSKSFKPDKAVTPGLALRPEHFSQPAKDTERTVITVDIEPGYESPEEDSENDYYNSAADLQKGVPVRDLATYVDKKDAGFYNTEFVKLPKGLVKSTDAALLEKNSGKSRYNGIFPYDETRVVLAGPGSDYINACYIEGYRRKRRYIASLGPVAKVMEGFNTFWRMVWQEKTEKIVMVTNLMENGGMKCEQYWPDRNATLIYGDVTVTCHTEDMYAEYTVRSFSVCKKNEKRSLHHIHYTAWPDKRVPDDVTSLVEFRNKVNSTKTKLHGPIIVHCSAGVGRTGTYIALDILTLKGKQKGAVDIFECVDKLRQQRAYMVQTAEQYEYLHRALVHTLTLESEAIPAGRFQDYTASLSDSTFDRLSHCTEKVSDDEKEAIVRNKTYTAYNRTGADIPGDFNRPRLHYDRTTNDNNYINAIFVNSFKRKHQFILAQTPLTNTVDDFLTLAVQENCCCIVSMDAIEIHDKTIGTYLPADNQTLSTEAFDVKSIKLDSHHRTLVITSKRTSSTVKVQHFLCANWSDRAKTPKSSPEFLTFVQKIQKVADDSTQFAPVIVHCRSGSERSALLCVVLNMLQKIEIEHEVSVINTVRQVKIRRPKSIPNKEQFKFCHQCVSAYLQSFDIYSNFT